MGAPALNREDTPLTPEDTRRRSFDIGHPDNTLPQPKPMNGYDVRAAAAAAGKPTSNQDSGSFMPKVDVPKGPAPLTSDLKSSATGGAGSIPTGARVAYFGGVPISLSDNYASSIGDTTSNSASTK